MIDGWEVSGRRARALLTLVDETPRAKVLLKGGPTTASLLGVPMGRAARDGHQLSWDRRAEPQIT